MGSKGAEPPSPHQLPGPCPWTRTHRRHCPVLQRILQGRSYTGTLPSHTAWTLSTIRPRTLSTIRPWGQRVHSTDFSHTPPTVASIVPDTHCPWTRTHRRHSRSYQKGYSRGEATRAHCPHTPALPPAISTHDADHCYALYA